MAGTGIPAPVVSSECNQSDDNIFPFLWKRSQEAVVWSLSREEEQRAKESYKQPPGGENEVRADDEMK
jgi:hypothetical protein